jgi:hypothetical protein
MVNVPQSLNFEFFRGFNPDWFSQLAWSEQLYALGQYHNCSNNIRTFLDDCIVPWIYDKERLTEPAKQEGKIRVELMDKICHPPFKKCVSEKSIRTDMYELVNITNPPSHTYKDTFNKNPENAKGALERLYRVVVWFYREFCNGNPLEISDFVLPPSQEELRQGELIAKSARGELQNTRSNFHALQKRQKIRQEDTETQEKIMAFIFAAAPLDENLAIDVLKEQKLHRPEENIKYIIMENIIKKVGNTLLVEFANPEAQEICAEAYSQHLPDIISLLERLA